MKRAAVIGLDAGSSSVKAAAFDLSGTELAVARVRVAPCGEGYDPADWDAAAGECFRMLLKRLPGGTRVVALGLTGQIGTHVPVLPDGTPLGPALSWQDARAHPQAVRFAARYCAVERLRLLDVQLPVTPAWPVPRLAWLAKAQPGWFARGMRLWQPKEYLLFQLTGVQATDPLSLIGLVSPHTMRVHPEVEAFVGLGPLRDRVPPTLAPMAVAGTVSVQAAARLGLAAGTPVVTGCGDFQASLLGAGCLAAGAGFNVTGTSDHIGMLVPRGTDTPAVLARYPSLVEGLDVQYGVTSGAGASLQWFQRVWEDGTVPEAACEAALRTMDPLLFLPYLNGERSPIWDPQASGAFIGLTARHTREAMYAAVCQGIAMSLRHIVSLLPRSPARLRLAGSAAASALLCRIKADVLNMPVEIPAVCQSACLGAAMLAAVGVGVYRTLAEAAAQMARISHTVLPGPSSRAYNDALYALYEPLYERLKEDMHALYALRPKETEA